MKKVFVLMVAMALQQTGLLAQERDVEVMTSVYVKADAMANTPGSLKWKSEHVRFTEWDDGRVGMGLVEPPHIFTGGRDFMGNRRAVNNCKIGLYDVNDELVWLAEKWKVMPGEGGTVLFFAGEGKAVNQLTMESMKISTNDIMSWLKRGGYVRFIADVYGDYNFDVSARIELP